MVERISMDKHIGIGAIGKASIINQNSHMYFAIFIFRLEENVAKVCLTQ